MAFRSLKFPKSLKFLISVAIGSAIVLIEVLLRIRHQSYSSGLQMLMLRMPLHFAVVEVVVD
ncbi:hypothetical protein COLO4_35470 [Corchorus olitorius]|uniref:Uncharacterized protein n=1 Tax=Corchorus olitorius TaxID=93759 RepID=A0A1R3GGL9_9ROSI|nr:hypothetical protein COLO4_35470 [Corchorus olitorius]